MKKREKDCMRAIFATLSVSGETILKRFVTLSVMFSLIFSYFGPLLEIQNIQIAHAAEVGYAPQASVATTVVDGIGHNKNVSINAVSSTSTNIESGTQNILPSQSHVDESSGAFLWSLPITLPAGRAGMTPSLTLSYDSRRNNTTGYIGKGWEMDIPYIQRINKVGMDLMYDRPDFASSTQGELIKLVPMTSGSLNQSGVYGAKSGYGRYELRNDNSWSMTDLDGNVYIYGAIARDREQSSVTPSHISQWFLSSITDTSGNKIEYNYTKDEYGRVYPNAIVYGDGVYRVTFEWTIGSLPKSAYLLGTSVDYGAGLRPKADRTLNFISVIAQSETRLIYDLISSTVVTYTQATGNYGTPAKTNVAGLKISGGNTGVSLGFPDNYNNVPSASFSEQYNFTYKGAVNAFSSSGSGTYGSVFPQLTAPVEFLAKNGSSGSCNSTVVGSVTPVWSTAGCTTSNTGTYTYIDLDGDGWKENVIIKQVGSGTSAVWTLSVYGVNSTKTAYELKPGYGLSFTGLNVNPSNTQLGDIDGDGKLDMIISTYVSPSYINTFYKNTGTAFVLDATVTIPNEPDTTQKILRDINADGKADIILIKPTSTRASMYISNGTGFTFDPKYMILGGKWSASSQSKFLFKDLNGDTLEDLVRDSEIFLNRKTFFEFSESYSLGASSILDAGKLVDINGDTLPDIQNTSGPMGQMQANNSSNISSSKFNSDGSLKTNSIGAFINTGFGFKYVPNESLGAMYAYTSQFGESSYALPNTTSSSNYASTLVDMNGDGIFDSVYKTNTSSPLVTLSIHPGHRENIMTSVYSPSGNTTTITYGYETLKNTNVYGESKAHYVVKSLATNASPANTTTYTYTDGLQFVNPLDMTSKFAGFATVATQNTEGIKEISYYHQGGSASPAQALVETSLGEYQDSQYKIGREYRTEIYTPTSAGGVLAKVIITKWGSGDLGSGRYLVFPEKVLTRNLLGGSYDTAIGYTYDTAYGKVVRVHDLGLVLGNNDGTFADTGTDTQTTDYKYISNGTLVRPSLVTKRDKVNKVLSQSATIYDNGTLSRGLPTETNSWIDSTTIAKNKYTYNSYGLLTSSTDPLGNKTITEYDSYNLYPKKIKNPLEQETTMIYDYMAGKPTKVTNPNGIVMEYIYDGYGRERSSKKNSVEMTTTSYTPTSQQKTYQNSLSGSTGFQEAVSFDGLGRVTSTSNQKKGNISYTYNSSGRRITESVPNITYGAPLGVITTYTYDTLGRVLTATNSLGVTTTSYDGLTKTITNPNGIIYEYVYDVRGNLLSVTENKGANEYKTMYVYDGNGNLNVLTDAQGNKRGFITNLRGDVLSATDLHAVTDTSYGMVKKTYDSMGRVLTMTLQDNKIIVNTYDKLGRVKTTSSGSSATPEEVVTYEYDTCMQGMLCNTTSSLGISTGYTYNPQGFVATKTQTIDGVSQAKTYTYDTQGQVMSITEPDGTLVVYDRTTAGANIEKVSVDGAQLVYSTYYDTESRIRKIEYKYPTVAGAPFIYTDYTYDNTHMLQLTNQKTSKNISGTPVVHLLDTSYTYDPNGNITQSTENGYLPLQSTKNYTYDAVDRLTNYTTTPSLGSPSPLDTGNYIYSPTGNITNSGAEAYTYGPLSVNNTTGSGPSLAQLDTNKEFKKTKIKDASFFKKAIRTLAFLNPFRATVAYAQTTMGGCVAPQVLVPSTNTCAMPIVCTAPAVRNVNTNTCVTFTAPICTAPQVLVPKINSCALPVVCTAPATLNTFSNTCAMPPVVCTPPQVLNGSGTMCVNPPPPPNCSTGTVWSSVTNTCVIPPPVCTAPQVLVPSTNSCAIPISCTSPHVIDVQTNTCKLPLLTLEDVKNFLKSKGFGSQQTGRAVIKPGYNKVTVNFKDPFASLPLISATPVSKTDAKFYLSDITSMNFRIKLFDMATDAITFNWNAIENPNDDGTITESEDDLYGIENVDMTLNIDNGLANALNANTTLYNEIPPLPTSVSPTSSFTSPQAMTKRGDIKYTYDARGNMVSEIVPTIINTGPTPTTVDAVTTHEWNAKNKLTKTTLPNGDVITYRYAPDGNRVMKKFTPYTVTTDNPIKITTYMDDEYEIEESTPLVGQTPTLDKSRTNIMLGSVHIATIEKTTPATGTPTTSTYYQLTNQVGSSTLTLDQAGTIIQAQDTKPYGGYRVNEDTQYVAPIPQTTTTLAIAGTTGIKDYYALHERDTETGLTYMNARMYTETGARFLSLDPASQYNPTSLLHDPQQLNLYSYARNNPVRYNDPSGEAIDDDGDLLELGLGFVPIAGEVIDGYNAIKGKELFGGEQIDATSRLLTTASLAVPFVGGRLVSEVMGPVIAKGAGNLIEITRQQLAHVIKRHAWNSKEDIENASKFLKGIDPVKLVNQAAKIAPTSSIGGTIIRTITTTKTVGFDAVAKKYTNTYTVITKILKNGKESLSSVHPGLPKPKAK